MTAPGTCDWAACTRPALREADGWLHCRPHLHQHLQEFAPATDVQLPQPRPIRGAQPSDFDRAWELINSNTGRWTLEEILGRGRDFELCHHRQQLMHTVRTQTRLSLTQIGRLFDRDHTTVIHALRQVERRAA